MSRLIKRKRKRILQRRLRFMRSPKGAVYCKAGCLTGYYHEKYFYIVVRNGDSLQWTKVLHYGIHAKIPRWLTASLRKKQCSEELALLEEIKRWVENGPQRDPTKIFRTVEK